MGLDIRALKNIRLVGDPKVSESEKVNLIGGNKRTSSAVKARGNKSGIQFGMKKAS